MMKSLRQDWLSNIRNDLLAGLVVALALIPEAIAFSIIAGVDPKVGLYASFCIAAIIAFVGGRPGMISAATGAMALVMVVLVKEHGLQYLLPTNGGEAGVILLAIFTELGMPITAGQILWVNMVTAIEERDQADRQNEDRDLPGKLIESARERCVQ